MQNNSLVINSYQKHIDGIRALAVLIVWLFHLNPNLLPGGFIGVDIFFVVSGYVISLSIFNSIAKNNNFSFFKFYLKRFFRIFPVLLFMLISVFIFYLYYGYLFELNYVSKIALASVFGVSNLFYIYLKSDYFLENELNPFLHTWSLGVEEQFYFIYPLIISCVLFLTKRYFKTSLSNNLKKVLFLFILISFFCFFYFNKNILGNFYFPLARFWEILIGCFIFITIKDKKIYLHNIIFLILLFIFVLILFYANLINNIYVTLIFATFFASVLIVSKNKYLKILSNRHFVYCGKISYSLYLWHFPVLYFSKIYLQGIVFIFSNFFIVIFLSILSYHIIEKPFRYNKKAQKIFLVFLSALIFLLIFISLNTIKSNNNIKNIYNYNINNLSLYFNEKNIFESKFNLSDRINWDIDINNQNIEFCQYSNSSFNKNDIINKNCLLGNSNDRLFIINGDSHATHYFPMINNLNLNKSVYLRTFEGCMFVPDLFILSKEFYINKNFENFNNCQNYISQQIKSIKSLDKKYLNSYLILSSRYTAYIDQFFIMNNQKKIIERDIVYDLIYNSLDSLAKELNNINIILTAPLPEFKYYPFSCLLYKELCFNDYEKDNNRIKEINNIFKKLSQNNHNVSIFNPYEKICNIKNRLCSMYNIEKDLLFFKDTDHLTVEGSKYLTKYFDIFLKKIK